MAGYRRVKVRDDVTRLLLRWRRGGPRRVPSSLHLADLSPVPMQGKDAFLYRAGGLYDRREEGLHVEIGPRHRGNAFRTEIDCGD